MQCYTQLTLPSATTHAVSLPFLSATATNLILVKTSLLQVYAFKLTRTGNAGLSSTTLNGVKPNNTTNLVLLAEYELSGTVTSLARIKTVRSRSGGEAIIVALRDAKLSLIEWDPETYSISTISIHYFEKEGVFTSPWVRNPGQCTTYLAVDSQNRCAALKFGSRHMAILPFHQAGDDVAMEDVDASRSGLSHRDSTTQINAPLPHGESFVLSMLALDPQLVHPLHFAFLHGYREPTLGILSTQIGTSMALLGERRDNVVYTVYTLDLEQRASTTLLSVTGLPYDIHEIIPLTAPTGGALLVGDNEIIHVDQAGKATGIGVNEFAKQSSKFPLATLDTLSLKLENCKIVPLGNSGRQLLIVLNTGDLVLLSLQVDGRSLSGMSVRPLEVRLLEGQPSCVTVIGKQNLFIGSEVTSSIVVGWYAHALSNGSLTEIKDTDQDWLDSGLDNIEVEEEDDLYADEVDGDQDQQRKHTSTESDAHEYIFRVHDELENLGPMTNLKIPEHTMTNEVAIKPEELGFIGIAGSDGKSSITKVSSTIQLSFSSIGAVKGLDRIWSLSQDEAGAERGGEQRHSMILTSKAREDGSSESQLHVLEGSEIRKTEQGDFDSAAGATVEIGAFEDGQTGKIFIQVLANEIRVFDTSFGLSQIVPLSEDSSDEGPSIVTACFSEPFVALLRDDGSIFLLKIDEAGELQEVDGNDSLPASNWASAALYDDTNDVFRLSRDDADEPTSVLMFLLDLNGSLYIYNLSHLKKPAFVANGLSLIPPFLSTDFTVRRSAAKDKIEEIVVADLGTDLYKSPYLVLRSATGDLVLYQPYQYKSSTSDSLRFSKLTQRWFAASDDPPDRATTNRRTRLRIVPDLNGYSVVICVGKLPRVVLRTPKSTPQSYSIASVGMVDVCQMNHSGSSNGLLSLEQDVLRLRGLHGKLAFMGGCIAQTLVEGDRIHAYDYHDESGYFVMGCSRPIPWKLPIDELHPEWESEDATLMPTNEQSVIQVWNAKSGRAIDELTLDPGEMVTALSIFGLETSEINSNIRPLITVGTAIVKGEEITTQGRIYVFDIISVVPDPDRPESGRKLKLISKETVKGAVTGLSSIGSEGFLLVAQGQKATVRGLKEDGTMLPVAFLDTQCYTTAVKELPGSGLCLLGDAMKGVWLAGYSAEPYRFRMFGKSTKQLEVVTADFLADGKQLYVVVVDAECDLHIMQYDPQNPKSLAGQRLLPVSTFHTGAYPSTIVALPYREGVGNGERERTDASVDTDDVSERSTQLVLSDQTGAISILTSLDASEYRTLTALQSFLINILPHPLGLNPRAYRHGDGDVGRTILDGGLLRRWTELGSWKRAESVTRSGCDSEWDLRRLLQKVGAGGQQRF